MSIQVIHQITHEIVFWQGSGSSSSSKSIVLKLSDSNFWCGKTAEDTWRQGPSDPSGIKLYSDFSMEDYARLRWKWNDSEHGGLIQVGINTTTETIQARASKAPFTPWLSFRGAQRWAYRHFYVAGGKGEAFFELAGSSSTFRCGRGEWFVRDYQPAQS